VLVVLAVLITGRDLLLLRLLSSDLGGDFVLLSSSRDNIFIILRCFTRFNNVVSSLESKYDGSQLSIISGP